MNAPKAVLVAVTVLPLLFACKHPSASPSANSEKNAAVKVPAPSLPETKKVPVTNTYHGVKVVDDYQWLENFDDSEVKTWSQAQSAYARAHLDGLPGLETIRARVTEVMKSASVSYYGTSVVAKRVFVMKNQPPKQQPLLVVMDDFDAPETARVVLDPNEMPGEAPHIDWYIPSPNGKLIAISLSKKGTESGDLFIYEVDTGKRVFETIERVQGGTAGGDLTWTPDGKGFYYTRYPRTGERPPEDMDFYQQLYFHQLGQPVEKDRYELGKELPRIAEIQLQSSSSGQVLVTVQKGDGGEFAHFLRSVDGTWRQFSEFGDKRLAATFGKQRNLYVLTREGAPRGKLVSVSTRTLDFSKAKVVLAEGKDTIVEDFWGPATVVVTANRLYVQYQLGGPSEIRTFTHDGKPLDRPRQLDIGSVGSISVLDGDDILFSQTSFVEPYAYWVYRAGPKTTTKTKLAAKAAIGTEDIEVRREFTTSKDGTKIPVNIIMKKGTPLDGTRPCVVYGYGGYGVNLTPSYSTRNLMFTEQGVIYALANIRGGGEFGEDWHRQGNLTNKQNVFDDFAAAVQYMVDKKYAHPDRMGIMGGSNGGLLMGATFTQNPTLAKAVVSFVGIYDMLRVELSANGSFNIPEFGTVKNPDHFEAMRAYSPYHNVENDTAYPPILFITGENDPRVDPMQSRKMTARLQAVNAAKTPVLLRTTAGAGHGGTSSLDARISQSVDMYAFFFKELGVTPKKSS